MEIKKHLTIEKATIFISLLGLFSSIYLSQKNAEDNIRLEEKKLEATLFLKSIEVNNKTQTLENITFLLKMGVLSPEREKTIQMLTDSLYIDKSQQYYTNSDTMGFYDLTIYRDKTKSLSLYENWVRGVYVQVDGKDSANNLHLKMYSDYQGNISFSFPKIYCGTFVKFKIIKKGFKSKKFEIRLPQWGDLSEKTRQDIYLEKIK